MEVVGVAALFSYQFAKAKANFESADCPYFTISNYTALLTAAKDEGSIDDEQLASLAAWREDPQAWSDKIQRTV